MPWLNNSYMKKTYQILLTLLCLFTLPLLTSWLLDWPWITRHWTREALVILLMITEVAIAAVLLKLIVQSK